jgi:predicted dienelactone hydrolase
VAPESKPLLVELNVMDQARGRDIPLHVFLPAVKTPAPVILFSHGLGGSGREYTYLGELWAARGYAVIFIQHRGSDISVWQDKAPQMRLEALKKAASLSNFLLRVKDVSVVLDKLASLNASSDNVLSGRLDLSRVGMAGHSFGAITTQAVSGQNTGFDSISFIDSRIKAALIMSPSKGQQLEPSRSFGSVKIPWMIMTGTYDLVPDLGQADMESRLAVFSALPPGGKYELVLFNAEHSVFTDRALPGDSRPRNPNHHHAILALSSAFWDAWLRNDAQAKSWLDGDGPGTVLEAKDHWQRK